MRFLSLRRASGLRRSALYAVLLATGFPAAGELPPPVLDRLRAAGLPDSSIGVVVQRVRDGATLVTHGADRAMQPASTLKLLTSLAALETLGPAFRGRTQLLTTGEPVGGVLATDLVLRGGADVDLDWRALEGMLRVLRLKGVRELRANLVLDRTYFEPARTDVGVAPFDEAPEFRYNVIPDALLPNTNLLGLDLVSDAREVRVAATPALEGVSVASAFSLVDRNCDDWEDGWIYPEVKASAGGSIRIRLQGEFPRNCTAATAINVIERVAFTDRLFRSLWHGLGGTFHGRTREGDAPQEAHVVAEHRSRPLSEVVRDINKRSDNPTARVLYLTLGAVARGEAGAPLAQVDASEPTAQVATREPTAMLAEREVRAWLQRNGIGADGLVLENGSGLSRRERIRTTTLAGVLRAGIASPWAPEFLASLPIVAVDGGMRKRLRGSAASERARVKTGTLRDVSAVAGYVKDAEGEVCIVVAMVNGDAATRQAARPVLDALIEWVAAPRARAGTPP